MDSNANQSNESSSEVNPVHDNWPLWKYVTKIAKGNEGGGNQLFKCIFCNNSFKGSYSRVKCHLLKISGGGIRSCQKIRTIEFTKLTKEEEEASERRDSSSKIKMVPLPKSVPCSSQASSYSASMDFLSGSSLRKEGHDPKKKRKGSDDSPLEKAFNVQCREQLDFQIARMFYSAGLPFNLARNPYFRSAFAFAANNNIAGYVPPGYNTLRTKLLQKERNNVEELLQTIKSTWKEHGMTIVCDGWSDPQRRPLINFMAINELGAIFLRAVNCQGECKDKYFIANLIKDVIQEVGANNVVQVITDNAPVCKAAGKLIEQAYPSIFWTPCVVHTLNLALKNICAAKNTDSNEIAYSECHWITEVVGSAVMVRNFIMTHSMRLSMFNEFSKLKLLAIAETRFASAIVMLKRFRLVKNQLIAMVTSDQWSCYRDDDVAKARLVREKVLDEEWWDLVDYILAFTEPIYDMIRVCDTDKSCLHLVYEMWHNMILKVKKAIYRHERKQDFEDSTFWNVIQEVLEDRWSKSNTPLHCLAHSLNPRCTTKEWQEIHPHLISPQNDAEISNMRNVCLKRLFPSDEIRKEAINELGAFFGCFGHFSDVDSLKARWEMHPMTWWLVYGSGAPNLRSIVRRLFGQVSSSSCCERNWSTYAFIHSSKRNQITPQRAEDLVFVHSNLRLLSRKEPHYVDGETKMWDVGGDGLEPLDEVGILEIADLTLDEPELEAQLFDDGIIDVGGPSANVDLDLDE